MIDGIPGLDLTLPQMKIRGRGICAWMGRISVLSMAVLYLLASSQLGHALHEWVESHEETVVQQEAFACAFHQCACKNAMQCKTNCCCFPKASVSDSHSHGDDDSLTPKLANCGTASGDDHGLMPLSPHIQADFSVVSAAIRTSETLPDLGPGPTSRLSDSPFKVPI
jgi:hypothetical protein